MRPPAYLRAAVCGRPNALYRTIVRVQKMYFDPPDLDGGRMPRVSKWEW
jgi:hypothetical protein